MCNLSYEKFIKETDNFLINDKLSHAYLVELSNYDSYYQLLLSFINNIFIKYNHFFSVDKLLCLLKNNDYPDFIVVEADGTVIKKQQIKLLQEEFKTKSVYENKKIYLIKEAEKMNQYSLNTILKFLEEPEENIIAFLVTKNVNLLKDTIISRCQLLEIKSDILISDDYNEVLDIILSGEESFIKFNDLLEKYFFDRENSKLVITNLIRLLENNSQLNICKTSEIILILEEELTNLDYNINMKLFLDKMLSKIIGAIND